MWLHGFCLFYVQLLVSSTYRFSFTVNKFKWDEFYICEFVSFLIKMLCYCVVGLLLSFVFGVLQICLVICVSSVRCILLVCWECFACATLYHVNVIFGCACDRLLDVVSLACVFKCT